MHRYDVGIVLGGGIDSAGQLSPEVPPRVKRGLTHYWSGNVGHLVLSGGWSHRLDFTPPRSEAAAMLECALELGAPPDSIDLEEKSTGTISQAYETKVGWMLPREWDSALIIGAERHSLQRLEFIFRRVWGPEYDISIETTKNSQARDIKNHERRALLATQLFLSRTSDGDHESVARFLATQNRLAHFRHSMKLSKQTMN